MVQFEAIFTGFAIALEDRNVMSGAIRLENALEALFKTEDDDVLCVRFDHDECDESLFLSPFAKYRLKLSFETKCSRMMGVNSLALTAKAKDIELLRF